jgi:hypothetical protein
MAETDHRQATVDQSAHGRWADIQPRSNVTDSQ